MENLLVLLLGSKQLAGPERREQDRLDRLLQLEGRAGSENVKVGEDNAQAARLMALVVELGDKGLDPFRDVEGCRFRVQDGVSLEGLRRAGGSVRPAP